MTSLGRCPHRRPRLHNLMGQMGRAMSKRVDGVPEGISRSRYLELIALSGFDIDRVQSLEFRPDGVERIDQGRNDVIKEVVFVPVVN